MSHPHPLWNPLEFFGLSIKIVFGIIACRSGYRVIYPTEKNCIKPGCKLKVGLRILSRAGKIVDARNTDAVSAANQIFLTIFNSPVFLSCSS